MRDELAGWMLKQGIRQCEFAGHAIGSSILESAEHSISRSGLRYRVFRRFQDRAANRMAGELALPNSLLQHPARELVAHREIGRASCRERGEISVVAGSL